MTARITIFSGPKPFTLPHIATIQRNAIRSWLALGAEVDVLLLGDEEGLPEEANELGVRLIREVPRNAQGTPLVSALFELARQNSDSPLLAYVNADILLLPDFVSGALALQAGGRPFLGVGQRWDLEVTESLEFGGDWPVDLQRQVKEHGSLHPPAGSDYFIYPRECFKSMPAFAIGRAGWDNWMIYWARREGWQVVDCTADINIVHQNHDYSHLPGGQPHYKLPETDVNVRLAGGRMMTRFMLPDCNRQLIDGRLTDVPFSWRRFWRETEIFPLVGLRSPFLGRIGYAVFHPVRAYGEARAWVSRRLRNTRPGR